MTMTMLPSGGIALVGAPNGHVGDRPPPLQAMQVEMTQDIVDELLESMRSGKPPQILFGCTPQLKVGDKTHVLQSSPEPHTYELYHSSGTGSDDDLEFAGVINHNLIVQEAADVTAGVDSALATLKSSMAAISEFKEANKTIVGDATPVRTPGHRRYPSTGFKPVHLAPSKVGSPLPSMPASPMDQRPPTSQPGGAHEAIVAALRVPVIHLLAREPASDASLARTCRTSTATVRELLPKIAKRSAQDTDKWQLTDKSFREINPYTFPYSSSDEREQAIEGAIKAFDRLRLTKEDKLWQILLPREERGQGKCLSRSKVKPLEAKPKVSTPLHKMSDFTKKKPVAKKVDDKVMEKKAESEKKAKVVKEGVASKLSKAAKERILGQDKPAAKEPKDDATKTAAPTPTPATSEIKAAPSTEGPKIRTKKVPAAEVNSSNSAPRTKPKMSVARDSYHNRQHRPVKPIYNTKPKNPSPLSASPPVNASDLEDSHPVHKALAASASPVKSSYGNSDRSLKRKANDIDSDIHNHSLAVKKPNADRATLNLTPSHTNGRLNGSTPSSNASLKRKSDDSSTSNTPVTAPKVRKVTSINVGLASRYSQNNSHPSPGDSSSSTTSPTVPSLSFRQTVELSQKFQKYYTKYEELYWRLTEATSPPTEAQRNDLLKMHKKLEEMKREIKAGARVQR
ncbi:COM1 regulatory protein [Stagonosporopsis vannaccii]|nr:COM1 regulatory protein [Stagonosporopsis vannaccii]